MKKKKILAAVLAGLMLTSGLAGCGEKKDSTDGEQVVLKWVMTGPGRQKDSEEVWAAVNAKLNEKIPNVTIDFDVMDGADCKQSVMLMQTGKEKLDIVNTYGLNFIEDVENGSFIDITDLLDEYGTGIKEQIPEFMFDYMRVGDGIYAVPSYQALANERCLVTQKEYADQWLDVEGLKKAMYSSDYASDEAIKIIEDYMQKLDENGKLYYGAYHYNEYPTKGTETIKGNFIVDNNTHEVYYKFEYEPMKEQYRRHAEWYKKGWIRKDALSCTDESEKRGIMEGYTLFDSGYNPWVADSIGGEDAEFIAIPFSEESFIPSVSAAGGNAITSSCEHPELAMQVLNLFQTDKELYNLLTFGIEGKHYTKVGENEIETPYSGQGTSNDAYGIYKWIVGNTQLAYLTQDYTQEKFDYDFNVVNKSDYRSDLIGFVPVLGEVADNIAQLDAIKGEYMKTLATGALGDGWEAYYNEWMTKANAAGLQKVKEILQQQVDEFLANKQ